MSIALKLVDSYVAYEQAKAKPVCLDVGGGMYIVTTAELAEEAVARGVGVVAEPRKSLFGYEPHA